MGEPASTEDKELRDLVRKLIKTNTPHPGQYLLEVAATILLSLATVASAWSVYQATRWSGLQAITFGEAGALRTEATRMTSIAARKITVDAGLFVNYAVAINERNEKLAAFLRERFPPRLAAAVDAWLKTRPLADPAAPRSPFEMKEYSLPELDEVNRLNDKADRKVAEAKQANQTGDNYILLTVMFSSVLFFGGICVKFRSFKLELAMLIIGAIIFVNAFVLLLSYPAR